MAACASQRKRWAVDRQQLLILLVGAVMVGSFFLFVLWPKQCELTALGAAVAQERGLVNQKVVTSREGVYVSARIPSLRMAKDLCERRLPTEPHVADFLRMVAECVATEPGVTHEIQRGETAKASAPSPAIPVTLRLAGPLEAVYRCLARIEGLERLNRVSRAHIVAGSGPGQVVAETEILVYYLPADGDPAPRTTAGAGGRQAEAAKG